MLSTRDFTPSIICGIDTSFRLCQLDDLQELLDCCYAGQPRDHTFEMLVRSLKRQTAGKAYHVVAIHASKPIASGQLVRWGRAAEIADLIVAPPYRRQKVGQALVTVLQNIANSRNWRPLEIGVTVQNRAALTLYTRMGYRAHRRLKLEDGQMALILRLPTTASARP